jgi:hypothetical protein
MEIQPHRHLSLPRMMFLIAVAAALISPLNAQTPVAVQTIWLSELDLSNARQQWGKPMANQSVDGHPLSIAGKKFEHGFGTHSVGRLDVDLHGSATHFHAEVGVDDDAGPSGGTVVFTVVGNGKQLWTSGIIKRGQAAKTVDLDLAGVKLLQLKVGDAGDGFDNDHADWVDARIEHTGATPVTVDIHTTQPTIAMDADGDAPVIHAAAVYGGVAGTPFLLAVPATGRSLVYSAKMPRGLALDPGTGIITGVMPGEPAEIEISVNRSMHTATQKFSISPGPAQTPPLGWNSYDGYGDSVTEDEMLANAKAIAEHLKPHGWQYVVVDYRWYDPGAHDNNPNGRKDAQLTMDANGRLQPSPNRFPSAANGAGFKPLADRIHAMGLRFGIHIMRGIPRLAVKQNLPIAGSDFHAADAVNPSSTCVWCPDMFGVKGETAAGQAYYDSIFKLYAQWGLDFVKVDDLSEPYSTNEVAAIRGAIDKSGRTIVFSTSPGPAPLQRAEHLKLHANMWRCTGDFWDNWGQLGGAMDVCANWNGHGGHGHWPDMDMLPLGRLSVGDRSVGKDRPTKFTHAEQVTLLTLWSIFPSPLMLGGDFTAADPWEIALLTNDEVIAVNQDSMAQPAMRVFNRDGKECWQRNLGEGRIAVALFNRTEDDDTLSASWADLDLSGKFKARDLWRHKELGELDGKIELPVPSHGAVMVILGK